jgi:hypothetical protein
MTFGISMLLWIYYILMTVKLVKFRVGGQLDDLNFGLSEDVKALDVGGRHLSSHGIQHGLYQDDDEEYGLDDFWTRSVVQWTPSVYVYAKVNLFEKLNLTSSFLPLRKTLCNVV